MLGKENIEKQVEMDYRADVEVLPTESAIGAAVDYEDRPSIEELQRGQSYRSQRSSTRSSSASSDDTWRSALNDTDNGISDEITKKATFFVKTFVRKFEKELSKLSQEAEPDSSIRKSGKIANQSASIVNHLVPPSSDRLMCSKAIESVDYLLSREHRRMAEKVYTLVKSHKDKLREILVKDGLEIFHNFEEQMAKVIDISWEGEIEKLAMDAASRVINYILINKEGFPVPHITKGVVLGKSKRKHQFTTRSGHRVRDKQSGEILTTSQLYENVGIKKIEGGITKYYQLKGYDDAEKYCYRLPFAWELEIWSNENICKEYMPITIHEEYKYILGEEKKEKLASDILKEINGEDLAQKKDIEELHKGVKSLQICYKKEDKNTFSFHLDPLPKPFIKRKMMLSELNT